jgi:DNA-binding transcriptional regulator YdaS (Cro superfamily)
MKNILTADDVRRVIHRECVKMGSQRAFARHAGLSVAYVSDVLARKREPAASICSVVGIDRVIHYEWKGEKVPS